MKYSVTNSKGIKLIFTAFVAYCVLSCKVVTLLYGVHKPEIYEERATSHLKLTQKIKSRGEGDFEILYRKIDFVEKTGYEEFYYVGDLIYNNKGLRADLNETANICEKSSFGYKNFKDNEVTLDQMIWETDTTALDQLLSGLETMEGKSLNKSDFPEAKYIFVSFYSSYVRGPQRRKSRLLSNSLDYSQDSIMTIYINADFIKTEFPIYAAQYKGFDYKEE